MACIHTQGLLIPFFCLLIKWIEYAKFTGRSSKEAKLYVFSQFSSLHSSTSAVFQLETPACWEGKFVVQEIWSLNPEQMDTQGLWWPNTFGKPYKVSACLQIHILQ